MVYLWIILLVLLNALFLVLVLFALPGNWLIVISTCLFAWWQEGVFSIYTLIAIVVLATLGELFEFFGGIGGARKAGAQWWGSFGALGGAISGAVLGTFLIPILLFGTLIGACVGAGTGACLFELASGRQMKDSARSGLGAGIGELLGITIKISLGFVIWATIAVAAFWP
ncbi:MAG: DUF456 domain-containing protein [Planctomycetes bacterium]|nr:DUF456 domain-containing protein [Planctomycetota bacterium]